MSLVPSLFGPETDDGCFVVVTIMRQKLPAQSRCLGVGGKAERQVIFLPRSACSWAYSLHIESSITIEQYRLKIADDDVSLAYSFGEGDCLKLWALSRDCWPETKQGHLVGGEDEANESKVDRDKHLILQDT